MRVGRPPSAGDGASAAHPPGEARPAQSATLSAPSCPGEHTRLGVSARRKRHAVCVLLSLGSVRPVGRVGAAQAPCRLRALVPGERPPGWACRPGAGVTPPAPSCPRGNTRPGWAAPSAPWHPTASEVRPGNRATPPRHGPGTSRRAVKGGTAHDGCRHLTVRTDGPAPDAGRNGAARPAAAGGHRPVSRQRPTGRERVEGCPGRPRGRPPRTRRPAPPRPDGAADAPRRARR